VPAPVKIPERPIEDNYKFVKPPPEIINVSSKPDSDLDAFDFKPREPSKNDNEIAAEVLKSKRSVFAKPSVEE
jgi:hypothetical protein